MARMRNENKATNTKNTYMSAVKSAMREHANVHGTVAAYGADDPFESEWVKAISDGYDRLHGQENPGGDNQSWALTLDQLRTIIRSMDLTQLANLRDATAMVLAFWSLLRAGEYTYNPKPEAPWEETPVLTRGFVTPDEDGLSVFLAKSKVDQRWRGVTLPVGRRGDDVCPQFWVQRWKDATNILRDDDPLFCNVHGPLDMVNFPVTPLTYQNFASRFKDHCRRALGPEAAEHLSTHSLRAGGATWMLDNGVAKETVKRLGRWKSKAWKRYYRLRIHPFRMATRGRR